jgi:septum site-determining protein MinC
MSYNADDASEIQLKGTGFGLRIALPSGISDDLLLEKFLAIPDQAYVLPVGTGVVLDFGSNPCSGDLIGKILARVIWPKDLNVLAWLSSDPASAARLDRAGFKNAEPAMSAGASAREVTADTAILNYSLRSGQREEFDGNVVLIGHLNNGAEIFAGGSVSILGKLAGCVHAGRTKTEGTYIVAGSFESQQVRFGDKFCMPLGTNVKWWKKPVIITLENDGFLFREWKLKTGNEATPV